MSDVLAQDAPERFRLVREVGRGTSGVVYLAEDALDGHRVALKLLHPTPDVSVSERLQEAEILSKLDHPNIVRIAASGATENGTLWVAMEWLDGESLEQRQHRQPLSLLQSLRLAAHLAEGLSAAHALGVVHRDIKPANVFLTYPDGPDIAFPKILDFGSATRLDTLRLFDHAIVGTPAYMAPEQVRGDADVGPASDLYALGATLYELLSGQPPHRGPSHLATLARLAATRPRRLIELLPEIPPRLDRFVASLMAPDPADRLSDARVVAQELLKLHTSIQRGSVSDAEPRSARLGSSASRVLTTIVAFDFANLDARDDAIVGLRSRGAVAVPLARDALVAHLGAHKARGNEAVAALRLGQRLGRENARVGVATGRALVAAADADDRLPVGEVVDRAIALARSSKTGQVLADATTSELARGRYEFALRPDGSAVTRRELDGHRADPQGGTPFVGRDAELGQIKAAFRRALTESRATLASISGPPGMGKTRLQREAVARLLASAEHCQIVHQRSEAYAQSRAMGAAADVVRSLLELSKSDKPATPDKTEKNANPDKLDPPPPPRGSLPPANPDVLARWIANRPPRAGEDARDQRDVLWLRMTQVVEASLAKGPVLIVAEDLQWADPESLAWFEHLLTRLESQPLLLLLTARQTFWQNHPDRFHHPNHLRIDLQRISDAAARTIAQSIVGTKLSEDAFERIIRQAAGLPLFAEELSRLAASGKSVDLAPTIEAAIQVSLDGLDEEARDAVGRLSVLGTAVWDDGLEALGLMDPERILTELSAHEILVEQASSRFFALSEWHFKHALVRDVAYNSLGDVQRRELHAAAGQWLENVGEDAAVVARHFDLAGQPAHAAHHWALAAERALQTSSISDALEMADRSLSFAQTPREAFERARLLDEAWSRHDARASERESAVSALEDNVYDEISAVIALGTRARYDADRGQGFEIDERLQAARLEAQRLLASEEEARCAATLAARLAFAGRFDAATDVAARLLEIGEQTAMKTAAIDGWQTLAIVHQSQGQVSHALGARRNAARAAEEAGLTERESMLTTNLGFALTTIGARAEARELLERGLLLAEAVGSAGAKRHAEMLLLGWAATFGTDRKLDAVLNEVRNDADAVASGMWTALVRENLGILYYRALELLRSPNPRNAEQARSLLELTGQAYGETQNRDLLPVALGMWAKAELLSGNAKRALELAQQAADLLLAGAPSLLNESPVYLVLHDLHQNAGELDAAREAVELGMQKLLHRLHNLMSTPYVRAYLTDLGDNATLVSNAERYGLLPDVVRKVIESDVD